MRKFASIQITQFDNRAVTVGELIAPEGARRLVRAVVHSDVDALLVPNNAGTIGDLALFLNGDEDKVLLHAQQTSFRQNPLGAPRLPRIRKFGWATHPPMVEVRRPLIRFRWRNRLVPADFAAPRTTWGIWISLEFETK